MLTSNNARELSDALKRRCLHLYIDFPLENASWPSCAGGCPRWVPKLAQQVVAAVGKLRRLELKKAPSISETLDWVQALVLLNADTLSPELVGETLNLVLKHEADVAKVKEQLHSVMTPSTPNIPRNPI